MLALFRNNRVTTAFILAVYVLLLHLPAILGWVAMPPQADDAGGLLYHDLVGWAAKNVFSSALGAAVLVLIQAILVNNLADLFRLMSDRNWLPGALYALAGSCLPDFLFLSPALVAVTFVPIGLRYVFQVYKQSHAFGPTFDAAFWIALAALFHPPTAWLLLTAFAGIMNLRSFHAREQVIFLTGIFIPVFLVFTGYLWVDRPGLFLDTQFNHWIGWPTNFLAMDEYSTLKTGLMTVLLITVLLGVNVYYYKKLIQVQKYITVFYWFMFAGMLGAVLQSELHPASFILLMPSIAVFLSYSLQSLRRQFMAEIIHLALLATVFLIQFFPNLQQYL